MGYVPPNDWPIIRNTRLWQSDVVLDCALDYIGTKNAGRPALLGVGLTARPDDEVDRISRRAAWETFGLIACAIGIILLIAL